MERVWRSLTAATAALALGTGCTGAGFWKSKDAVGKVPAGVPTAPLSPMAQNMGNAIMQTSATVPEGPRTATTFPTFTSLTGKDKGGKAPVTVIMAMWRNRIDYLPDPSPGKNGQMSPGLAGQLFLYGPMFQPAAIDGKLTIALYDETPRPAGQPANQPEGWEFSKETLSQLVTNDERFGRSYALFLPWPTYRPDVARIRIAVRYDAENGQQLYADETRITIDTSVPGMPLDMSPSWSQPSGNLGAQPFSPLGGPPPAGGVQPNILPFAGTGPPGSLPLTGAMPANAGMAPINPVSGPKPPGPAGPNGLPPIAIIRQPGQ